MSYNWERLVITGRGGSQQGEVVHNRERWFTTERGESQQRETSYNRENRVTAGKVQIRVGWKSAMGDHQLQQGKTHFNREEMSYNRMWQITREGDIIGDDKKKRGGVT